MFQDRESDQPEIKNPQGLKFQQKNEDNMTLKVLERNSEPELKAKVNFKTLKSKIDLKIDKNLEHAFSKGQKTPSETKILPMAKFPAPKTRQFHM